MPENLKKSSDESTPEVSESDSHPDEASPHSHNDSSSSQPDDDKPVEEEAKHYQIELFAESGPQPHHQYDDFYELTRTASFSIPSHLVVEKGNARSIVAEVQFDNIFCSYEVIQGQNLEFQSCSEGLQAGDFITVSEEIALSLYDRRRSPRVGVQLILEEALESPERE